MVRDRTMDRYAAFAPDADPVVAAKFERLSGAAGNVAGIMYWLDKTEQKKRRITPPGGHHRTQ